eukprot:TRINITY_DN18798_c0_g2_i3.p1 TRINITY_DN18798_c0_g2~~TRINITY_DN18798_c0_g2_i3.p1  ORF type:complete len:158 (-),score=8.73 TRINITY_DN18798_c0_g2_i3:502-975(-)
MSHDVRGDVQTTGRTSAALSSIDHSSQLLNRALASQLRAAVQRMQCFEQCYSELAESVKGQVDAAAALRTFAQDLARSQLLVPGPSLSVHTLTSQLNNITEALDDVEKRVLVIEKRLAVQAEETPCTVDAALQVQGQLRAYAQVILGTFHRQRTLIS